MESANEISDRLERSGEELDRSLAAPPAATGQEDAARVVAEMRPELAQVEPTRGARGLHLDRESILAQVAEHRVRADTRQPGEPSERRQDEGEGQRCEDGVRGSAHPSQSS
jgi:hypothetical protein